jgi:hypothetical protein
VDSGSRRRDRAALRPDSRASSTRGEPA